jgi:hypothetical protein
MAKSGNPIAECVECGSRAVVVMGELTSDTLVLCSECGSPRGIFTDFFEEIRAAALSDSSSIPEHPAQSSHSLSLPPRRTRFR